MCDSNSAPERAVCFFREQGAFCCITPFKSESLISLMPEELELSKALCTKRLHEFAMGRMLARTCFKALGVPDRAVLIGECREPLWPLQVVGSISHTNDIYGVVTSLASESQSVGIDIEKSDRIISDGAFALVSNNEECKTLYACGLPEETARVALFSAKESFYKLLYPLVKRRFSFDGARLISADSSKFVLELTMNLTEEFTVGWQVDVAIFVDEQYIVSCSILK